MTNIIYYTNWCGYCNELLNVINRYNINVKFIKIDNVDSILNDNSIEKSKNNYYKVSPLFVSDNHIIGSIYSFMNYFHVRY
jgi:glutaredoxin